MQRPAVLWVLIFLTLLFASPAAALKIPFGDVSNQEGAPTINLQPTEVGTRVFAQDQVATDAASSVEIRTKRGDWLTVGPSSELVVERGSDTEKITHLNLRKGLARSVVNRLKPKESFTIETNVAVAGVKGTEFIAFAGPNATSIFTREGAVEIVNAAGEAGLSEDAFITQVSDDIAPLALANFQTDPGAREIYELVYALTNPQVPAELQQSERLPDIIARFNINYASLLVDRKGYPTAVLVYELAARFAESEELQAEALANKVKVESVFLKDLESALEDVRFLVNNYSHTGYYEFALYQRGLINLELNRHYEAKSYLEQYLSEFPNGKYASSAKTLLEQLPSLP